MCRYWVFDVFDSITQRCKNQVMACNSNKTHMNWTKLLTCANSTLQNKISPSQFCAMTSSFFPYIWYLYDNKFLIVFCSSTNMNTCTSQTTRTDTGASENYNLMRIWVFLCIYYTKYLYEVTLFLVFCRVWRHHIQLHVLSDTIIIGNVHHAFMLMLLSVV